MVNLLPEPAQKLLRRDYYVRCATVVLVLLALLSVMAAALLAPSYLLVSGKRDAARIQTDATQKLLALRKETPATAELAVVNERVRLLSQGLSRQSVYALIADVSAVRGTVSLSGILIDSPQEGEGGAVRISGTAPSRDALLQFISRVRQLPNIAYADVPVSDLVSSTNVHFTITAEWKRAGQ